MLSLWNIVLSGFCCIGRSFLLLPAAALLPVIQQALSLVALFYCKASCMHCPWWYLWLCYTAYHMFGFTSILLLWMSVCQIAHTHLKSLINICYGGSLYLEWMQLFFYFWGGICMHTFWLSWIHSISGYNFSKELGPSYTWNGICHSLI